MVLHQYVKSLLELELAVSEVDRMTIYVGEGTGTSDGRVPTLAGQPGDEARPIFVIVSGEKDESGKSWCPDCVKAEPVLEAAARGVAPEQAVFITVTLPRDEWKDKNCVFRTDARFRLSSIPALLKWPNAQPRLEEEQCADIDAVKDFFDMCTE